VEGLSFLSRSGDPDGRQNLFPGVWATVRGVAITGQSPNELWQWIYEPLLTEAVVLVRKRLVRDFVKQNPVGFYLAVPMPGPISS
jgi:hypothetical protein